jgi:hypothetical protein
MSLQDFVDAATAIAREMEQEASSTMSAADELRNQVATLEQALREKDYERASMLGYQEISLAFVELQRCLGGVQALLIDEEIVIGEVSRNRNCSAEEARLYLRSRQQVTPV